MALEILAKMITGISRLTVEPVMFVDGACKEAMILFAENVQMNKICSVKFGYPDEVCNNLTAYPEHSVSVQREYSIFAFYNSIIVSVLPLIYVLFMGAWSDKYGRKIPMLLTLMTHTIHAAGYLLVNWQRTWPVEILYLITLVEALGGANMGLLSSTTSYVSDISTQTQRTSKLNILNSLWYLGSPLGTLVGALVIKYSGYDLALGIVVILYVSAIMYVIVLIKESHGPHAKKIMTPDGTQQLNTTICAIDKKDVKFCRMIGDFFNWHRVAESFKTAFKKREGRTRGVLVTIIVANMIRRMARGFFMYMFTRRVLLWDATYYGYWITYRNLLVALGSLFLVPLLTKKATMTDSSLVVAGSLSIVGEYISYGIVHGPSLTFLMWLGPIIGLLSNACVIALRSMCTKLVTSQEKGRISGVMAAMNALMPMLGYSAYSPIYYNTVDTFPATQFFVAACFNLIIMVAFLGIGCTEKKGLEDNVESGEPTKTKSIRDKTDCNPCSPVTVKTIVRTLSKSGRVHNSTKIQKPLEKSVEKSVVNTKIKKDYLEKSVDNPKIKNDNLKKSVDNQKIKKDYLEKSVDNPKIKNDNLKKSVDNQKIKKVNLEKSVDNQKIKNDNLEKSVEKSLANPKKPLEKTQSLCYSNILTDDEITSSEKVVSLPEEENNA